MILSLGRVEIPTRLHAFPDILRLCLHGTILPLRNVIEAEKQ